MRKLPPGELGLKRIWYDMIRRCEHPQRPEYKNYGGRGIKVCDRWHDFQLFKQDMGFRPPGLTLERLEKNGNYEPSNCIWGTWKQQNRNRRDNRIITVRGKTGSLAELAEFFGVNYVRAALRIGRDGWTAEDAFFKPVTTRPPWAKLDAVKIQEIIALRKSGETLRQIAAKFSVSSATIYDACAGNSYRGLANSPQP